jgi:hypothetical protein
VDLCLGAYAAGFVSGIAEPHPSSSSRKADCQFRVTTAPLDLKPIKTILGSRRRPRYRARAKRSAEWEVSVEKPAYDLTIFKLHCGKLTLKIYSKAERVLRIEAVVHNTQELNCGRSVDKFPLPCEASSTSSGSPLDHRQKLCRTSPRSAYA